MGFFIQKTDDKIFLITSLEMAFKLEKSLKKGTFKKQHSLAPPEDFGLVFDLGTYSKNSVPQCFVLNVLENKLVSNHPCISI